MDLTLTEDQQLISDTAREVLEARSETANARAVAGDPKGYSADLWKEMVELGWPGLALPEAHGGVGAGFLEVCLLLEQMGRFQVPSPFAATVAWCGPAIARYGTEAQRAQWLEAIARGRVLTYARGAPAGGWAPPERATDADVVATPSGDGYVVSGTAMFVPYADSAEAVLAVARREGGGEQDLVALVVDVGASGLRHEPLDVVGHDRQHRVVFDAVEVPAEGVLGGSGAPGREIAKAIAAYGAAATCAEMVGGAQQVLDMTVAYAAERHQFGRPIGSFQAVQHHCVDMAVDVLGSRFLAYEAIWRLSEGREASTEIAAAKGWVSEAYQRVCALGHQVHGAIGFTQEHDLHLYYRHATACALTFGDGDFHWGRLADRLMTPGP